MKIQVVEWYEYQEDFDACRGSSIDRITWRAVQLPDGELLFREAVANVRYNDRNNQNTDTRILRELQVPAKHRNALARYIKNKAALARLEVLVRKDEKAVVAIVRKLAKIRGC